MNTNNNKQNTAAVGLSKLIKPALNFAGIVGTVGGFVADVLSPIGPIITYLIYISIGVLIISTAILFLLPANKRNSLKSVSVTSLFFAIIFVLFGQLNEDTENGFLGDNIEFVAEFQSTLNIIDEKLDKISDQVAVVNEKIDNIDNKLDQGFNDLAELIKTSNPIQNPSTPKDYLLNAYLYKNGGDLKKSESSFLKFFELTESYKIDVLYDFLDVFGNVTASDYYNCKKEKNKMKVQSFFNINNSNDKVFKLFKTIYGWDMDGEYRDASTLIEAINNLNIDQNLKDFGIIHASNNSYFWNSLAWLGYYDYADWENLCVRIMESEKRLFSDGIDDIEYLIQNRSNIKKLLYSPNNPDRTMISMYGPTSSSLNNDLYDVDRNKIHEADTNKDGTVSWKEHKVHLKKTQPNSKPCK